MQCALRVLNVAMVIRLRVNTKILNRTMPLIFCFWFAANVDLRVRVDDADTEKKVRLHTELK